MLFHADDYPLQLRLTASIFVCANICSPVRYFILAIYVAEIDFILLMAFLGGQISPSTSFYGTCKMAAIEITYFAITWALA